MIGWWQKPEKWIVARSITLITQDERIFATLLLRESDVRSMTRWIDDTKPDLTFQTIRDIQTFAKANGLALRKHTDFLPADDIV